VSISREKQAFLDASPAQRGVVKQHLCNVLGILRAQSLSYQTSHWQVVGDAFYGNHLLFERLYGSVQEQIDQLAEKIVGYLDGDAVSLKPQLIKIAFYAGRWSFIDCHHERGIKAEKDCQAAIKAAYDGIKANGSMTLGLDDWLMATANAHDANAYLLQQSLTQPPERTASLVGAWAKDRTASAPVPRGHVASDPLAGWAREITAREHRASVISYTGPDGVLGWDKSTKRFSIFANDLPRRGAELSTGITIRSPKGGTMKFTGSQPVKNREGEIESWTLQGQQGLTLAVWND
tara:strand:- start:205 stop:1080 length:876 start_codon:yes stop_codon:yes gene_type:complete